MDFWYKKAQDFSSQIAVTKIFRRQCMLLFMCFFYKIWKMFL